MDIKKSDHLNMRISPEFKEKLNLICQQEHRTQSAQIEYWIENYKLEDEKEND